MNYIAGRRRIGELDWGGVLDAAFKTAGNIVQSSNQIKLAKTQADSAAQLAAYNLQSQQMQTGYVQSGSLIPGVPNIALLGGAVVLAFFLLKKR